MTTQPTFSIIIPTYNRAHLLPRAITSILRQTFTDFELIIVDDGSTDSTRAVAGAFKDPRLKYIYQENAGAAVARNWGVAEAGGRYVTFLDSDDEALPEWLAEIATVFQTYGATIVCCGVIHTFEERNHQPVEKSSLPCSLGPLLGDQQGLFITGGTFTVKTEVFKAIGGYANELKAGQHTELAWRLVPYCNEHGLTIHNIMKPLIRRHVHGGSSIRKDPKAVLQGTLYSLHHHYDLLNQLPRAHGLFWSMAGVSATRLGKHDEAKRYFRTALSTDPQYWKHYVRFCIALFPFAARWVWHKSSMAK